MPHLICYDISEDKLRNKIGKQILSTGLERINKSVYLGTVGLTALKNLEKDLQQLIQKKGQPQDSVIVITVGTQQVQQMRIYGENKLDRDELAGERSTLIV